MRKLIRTDGTEQELVGPVSMRDIAQMIGAETLDVVRLRHLGQPLHVMLIDDHGYESNCVQDGNTMHLMPHTARKPVNRKATELYWANCLPGTTHEIVGDVVVLVDEDFNE